METSLEIRKYRHIKKLTLIEDLNIINRIEKLIHLVGVDNDISVRTIISEVQLKNGQFKSHAEARKKLSKWLK